METRASRERRWGTHGEHLAEKPLGEVFHGEHGRVVARARARWAADSGRAERATSGDGGRCFACAWRPVRARKRVGARERSSRKLAPCRWRVLSDFAHGTSREEIGRFWARFRAARTVRRDGPDDALRASRVGDDLTPRRARCSAARALRQDRRRRAGDHRGRGLGAFSFWRTSITRCTIKAATARRRG